MQNNTHTKVKRALCFGCRLVYCIGHCKRLSGKWKCRSPGRTVGTSHHERKSVFEFYRGLGLKFGQEKYWHDSLDKEWDWYLQPLLQELNLNSAREFTQKQPWWPPPAVEKRKVTSL